MLRLPFRNKVWRGAAGDFAGSGTGASMDFQDHRAYSPGDDPRHINWQAFARTGQYSMKLFREEIRPVVDLILDSSASMFFSPEKEKRSSELLTFLTESSLAAGASVRVYAVNGDAQCAIDPTSLRSDRWKEDLRRLTPKLPTLAAAPEVQRLPLRSHALRVFLSDLLFSSDPNHLLRTLAQKQGMPILFCPFLGEEANPSWVGNYDFIDAELKTKHSHRIEPATLRRYLESYKNHFAVWKEAAMRHQAPLARIPCEMELQAALYAHALPVKALETSQ
ncbi:DUF58 domain-containing protein [Luteolibacter algae]|uniref:DUF58 domain-containing protein n=1 Tax=Luteolibacter algae TaxID=454151 RepID=A0ABW5DC95_9BACT